MTRHTPGSKWRVLAHTKTKSVDVRGPGVFDELVVDDWFHMEQMDRSTWWMKIGNHTVHVTVGADGKAREVTVHDPGFYDLREDWVEESRDYAGGEARWARGKGGGG